jgi:hypothetical protein
MYINPKDPLRKSGPDQQLELFNQYKRSANGFSNEDVVGAAMNVLVNALRQAHATKTAAETSFDEHMGRVKSLLLSHYDSTGKRRPTFVFNQNIEMPLFDDRNKRNRF